jgi:hypothetical protein
MATPQCARCGATTVADTDYVLHGQALCALCYGLALSAGRDAPVVPTADADGLVRIDPPIPDADAPGPPDSGPGREPPVPPDAEASGQLADLLPAGWTISTRCRPRIDDDSVRPPAPADLRHPPVRPLA